MSHEMFEGSLYLPSDAHEVDSIVKTGRVPIPTSKEYGRGAVVFGSPKEARNDAFSSGLVGGRNNPATSLARLATVSVKPDNPLIVGGSNPAQYRHQYREMADQLMAHFESDDVQAHAEKILSAGSTNSPYASKQDRHALERARALTVPQERLKMLNTTMGNITRGHLPEASRTADLLNLPYDAVGNPSTGSAVAKKSEIVRLKNVRPLS